MPLISLIVYLVIFGLIMYLVNTYIPMAAPIKSVLNVVVVIILILWLVNALGLVGPLPNLRLR